MLRSNMVVSSLIAATVLWTIPAGAESKFAMGMGGATCMLGLHAALAKGFFAEQGLRVEGKMIENRMGVEQAKPHRLWIKTDTGITEADFGFFDVDQLHHMAAGAVDYYIVDGMNFGCQEVMVAPDSPIRSTADLKGKTIDTNPWWVAPLMAPHGHMFVSRELKAQGLEPGRDVTLTPRPWDALSQLKDYVAEGFKTGKFDAVGVGEPQVMTLQQAKVARSLFTQYEGANNREYCCFFIIKRAIVDNQPDNAALIVRAFRRARQWAAENPVQAVLASQAAGHYPAALPAEPSATQLTRILGVDRDLDVARALEYAFKERIDAGLIKTDKTLQELVQLHYRRIK